MKRKVETSSGIMHQDLESITKTLNTIISKRDTSC